MRKSTLFPFLSIATNAESVKLTTSTHISFHFTMFHPVLAVEKECQKRNFFQGKWKTLNLMTIRPSRKKLRHYRLQLHQYQSGDCDQSNESRRALGCNQRKQYDNLILFEASLGIDWRCHFSPSILKRRETVLFLLTAKMMPKPCRVRKRIFSDESVIKHPFPHSNFWIFCLNFELKSLRKPDFAA